eukprot:7516951-Lingulodinium_polyedra.AAC.1
MSGVALPHFQPPRPPPPRGPKRSSRSPARHRRPSLSLANAMLWECRGHALGRVITMLVVEHGDRMAITWQRGQTMST